METLAYHTETIAHMEKVLYDKEDAITLSKDTPIHLAAYFIGVLIGMGISYKLDPRCPLYRSLRAAQAEWYENLKKSRGKRIIWGDGAKVIVHQSGIDEDNFKITYRSGELQRGDS